MHLLANGMHLLRDGLHLLGRPTIVAGAALALGWALALWLSGRWRDPLVRVPRPAASLPPAEALAALVAPVLLIVVLLSSGQELARRVFPTTAPVAAGLPPGRSPADANDVVSSAAGAPISTTVSTDVSAAPATNAAASTTIPSPVSTNTNTAPAPAAPPAPTTQAEPLPPGSPAWHAAQAFSLGSHALVVALLWWLVRRYEPLRRRVSVPGAVWLAIGAAVAFVAVGDLQLYAAKTVLAWLHWLDPEHPVLAAAAKAGTPFWVRLQLVIGAVVVAPIYEEFFYRGVVLGVGRRQTGLNWVGVLCSGMFFGVVHLGAPSTVLPLCTLGWLLAYVRLRSGVLWPCILCHALYNARTMTLVLAGQT